METFWSVGCICVRRSIASCLQQNYIIWMSAKTHKNIIVVYGQWQKLCVGRVRHFRKERLNACDARRDARHCWDGVFRCCYISSNKVNVPVQWRKSLNELRCTHTYTYSLCKDSLFSEEFFSKMLSSSFARLRNIPHRIELLLKCRKMSLAI